MRGSFGCRAAAALTQALKVSQDTLGAPLLTLQGAASCSFHASTAQSKKSEMKRQLRELYKKVHPDRFHGHPFARDANEKSFKLLQEYLSEAKEGGSFGAIAGVPYRFVFYLHQKPENQPTRAATNLTMEEGLYKIGVTLPPPGRLSQFPGSEVMNPSANKAIGSLLAACGLESEYEEEEGYAAEFGRQSYTAKRLKDFVPRAAHILQQSEMSHFGPLEHLRLAQTALRMGRQVTVEFIDGGRFASTAEKAERLQQLAACLDKLPEEISGLTFLLGNGYGMDSHGRVRLQHNDSSQLWASFLLQIDLQACRDRQATLNELRALERAAAASLGLPLVCARAHLTLTPLYRSLLTALAEAGKLQPPVFSPPAPGLAMLVKGEHTVMGSASPASQQEILSACETSGDDGLFIIPANASSATVFSFIQENGDRLLRTVQRKQKDLADLEFLRHKTERRMRLRKLLLDYTVPAAQLRSCCIRLTQATDSLRNLLDGLPVRISHTNQVAASDDCINIAWNFEV